MEFNQEVPTASDGCDWLLNQCDNAIDNDQEDHTLAMWNHIGKGYSLLVWFEDDEYILFYCSCTWLQELVNAHFSTRSRFDFKNSKTSSCLHCVKSDQIRSFFWSVFSSIWTEYGEILRISPYSVRTRENAGKMRTRTTQNTSPFYAVPLVQCPFFGEFCLKI